MSRLALLVGSFSTMVTFTAAGQLASPRDTTRATIGSATILVDYGRPSKRGRKIIGELVPFGSVWRTGANEATTFVTTANLSVQGKDVPAGSYTIFTVPAQDKWTLIINKKTGEWGIPYHYESDELVRVPMQVGKTSGPVENFTINYDQGGGCTLLISWENTQASVKFTEK